MFFVLEALKDTIFTGLNPKNVSICNRILYYMIFSKQLEPVTTLFHKVRPI